ncbi:sulfurtransferase [Actinocatenispora thailandica]|uniref:Sulfurtransferase n=1 Tax=Actinocatenispora thailandica TaxID=227318 RepID=A0A7R7DVP0_9ACTN|nr:rhodanese-like domain-containing protein [Actinocatenispora thailandica]BCJ38744.1 sulfurtransferase [Actinocatenispora thailandica]
MFAPEVPTVSTADVPADAYLLDVREPDEWAAGHAPGAHHLPMQDVPARLGEVPMDDDVYVICRSGGRSAQVTAYLLGNGFDQVRNVDGGMRAWAAADRALESTGEDAPRII